MARKTERVTINGREYVIHQVGARVGTTLLVKMKSVLVGGRLEDLLKNIDEKLVLDLCDAFAKTTEAVVGPNQQVLLSDKWDDHFAGNYEELLEWLGVCMKVNFETFFHALPGLLGKATGAVGDGKQKPSEMKDDSR